jgi:uncharacterized protein (TIGR02594 family)
VRDNPRILAYLNSTTIKGTPFALHDETPWCAAFVNYCIEHAGMRGTKLANARSWLAWGVPLQLPRLGCIAIFKDDKRGPKSGHVGFYVTDTELQIHVYGGNQGNRVGMQPRLKVDLLGYRWPAATP